MMEENIGGITIKDIIRFQTRMLFGTGYGRIEDAKKQNSPKELIIACLRAGWADAFRHTSENTPDAEEKIKYYLGSDQVMHKEKFCLRYGKIAIKSTIKEYDDYYSHLLSGDKILSLFKSYASKVSTDEKCRIIKENFSSLSGILKEVKAEVTFGHIQKLFNMAIKLYLCLYMCREYLELSNDLFDKEIIHALPYADCPVDSVILERLEQKHMEKKPLNEKHQLSFSNIKWSKLNSGDDIKTYKKIQDSIKNQSNEKGEERSDTTSIKSNLYFDFLEWN